MAGAARDSSRLRRVLGRRQSSQIRFPPMVIASGASISGASPKMLPQHRMGAREGDGIRVRAYGRN